MSVSVDPEVRAESPVLRLRRHGRALTLPVLIMLLVAAAAGFFVGGLPEAWMNWAAGVGAILVFVLLGLMPLLSWLSNRVVVTDRRVIVRRGLLVHHRSEVPLSRVREVRSKRGPLQRMFGSGDIELHVGTDAPTLLRDVPGPVAAVDALQVLVEREFARVGLQHQQTTVLA